MNYLADGTVKLNTIYNEDCLEGMKRIPDGSVDMVLCDLPYGTTNNKWDSVLDFDTIWKHYNRVLKKNGAVVLFSQGIFTAKLILSNEKNFKYKIVWVKSRATNFLNAKKQPLRKHEDICIFYRKQPTYNPQMIKGEPYDKGIRKDPEPTNYNYFKPHLLVNKEGTRYPLDVRYFKTSESEGKVIHPTQKPVALFEYLIKTYTNEGEVVLDNCMGSGTTAVACINTNRNYIGFELDGEYYQKALDRIATIKQEEQ